MKDRSGTRLFLLFIGSLVAHALLLNALPPAWPQHAQALATADELRIETVPPVPELAALEQPKVEPASTSRTARRGPRSKPLPLPEASGTEPSAPPPTAAGEVSAETVAQDALAVERGMVEPTRPPMPAQLSLWLDPLALQGMVIVRSPTALLAAIPGYRDMLRGADINPFDSLRALRVYLPGLHADQLMLAGVHAHGEQAIVRAAQLMAASRERELSWRGNSQLRASAWLDGAGYDRGLAVHGAAFVIAPRTVLPGLLGERTPAAQVEHLSKFRRGVLVSAALHDVSSYLPMLRPCQLRSLRVSVNATLLLQLDVEYETSEAAAQAAACVTHLASGTAQLRWTCELLSRAVASAGSTRSQLIMGVTNEDIARLLDELCWSLRHALHA